MEVEKKNKCLFIVDPQYDFINGSLAVDGAKGIMDDLARYVEKNAKDYEYILISCDWHPKDHISFKTKDNSEGEWPPHCIKHTKGAAIYEPLMQAILNSNVYHTVLTKGENVKIEEYDAIHSNSKNKPLFMNLAEFYHIDEIHLCGIAGDICVLNTLQGIMETKMHDKVKVLIDFCPSIENGILEEFCQQNNVQQIS